ncbi:hypothetical protein GKZ89_14645 [Bacillus mangrovi]|uniref:Uncharacterized protein n=1 Tax=Metabacillus mangrovi TaxID=1491830 RepID=A0A7X2S7D3_9BACI|nr:hypothetical protein [Metabacillus mangrovi]MTH54640.1 hypothetical protein [Metabacillus mangrovi]
MRLDVSSISFENLNVLEIASQSGIFIGKNRQVQWTAATEGSHSGFGVLTGKRNTVKNNVHLVLHEHPLNQDS